MSEECLFCAIKEGKIPSFKIYENSELYSFLDINPANPGHIVLITKKHFRSLMELDAKLYADMFTVARMLALALLEDGAEGVNFLAQMGVTSGQRIPHAYIHIIPRVKDDNIPLFWNPKKVENAELQKLSSRISSKIKVPQEKKEPIIIEEKKKDLANEEVITLKPRTGGFY